MPPLTDYFHYWFSVKAYEADHGGLFQKIDHDYFKNQFVQAPRKSIESNKKSSEDQNSQSMRFE